MMHSKPWDTVLSDVHWHYLQFLPAWQWFASYPGLLPMLIFVGMEGNHICSVHNHYLSPTRLHTWPPSNFLLYSFSLYLFISLLDWWHATHSLHLHLMIYCSLPAMLLSHLNWSTMRSTPCFNPPHVLLHHPIPVFTPLTPCSSLDQCCLTTKPKTGSRIYL